MVCRAPPLYEFDQGTRTQPSNSSNSVGFGADRTHPSNPAHTQQEGSRSLGFSRSTLFWNSKMVYPKLNSDLGTHSWNPLPLGPCPCCPSSGQPPTACVDSRVRISILTGVHKLMTAAKHRSARSTWIECHCIESESKPPSHGYLGL